MERQKSQSFNSALDLAGGVAVSAAVFIVYLIIWSHWIRPYFYPWGDDFAVFVNSLPMFHPDKQAWFLQGFRYYFQTYPDLTASFSDFIRPGVNFTLYLEGSIFQRHWACYLLPTYAAIASMSGMLFYAARRFFSVRFFAAATAALVVGFAPSIDTNALWDPAFAFDLVAGALVFAGFLAFSSKRYLFACMLFTYAAFTKETALFALPTAAVLIALKQNLSWKKRFAGTCCFVLPLVAWAALRLYAFKGHAGVYITMTDHRHGPLHEAIVRALTGALDWPFATQVFRRQNLGLMRAVRIGGLTATVLFWLGAIYLASSKLLRTRHSGILLGLLGLRARWQSPSLRTAAFTFASLALPIALDAPRRFGAIFFPFFVLCLVAFSQHSHRQIFRQAAAILMLSVGMGGALLLVGDLRYLQPQAAQLWQNSRARIQAIGASTAPVLLVFDDATSIWSSGAAVARFAGYRGKLLRVDDLESNVCSHAPDVIVTSGPNGIFYVVSRIRNSCGNHGFVNMFLGQGKSEQHFQRSLAEVHMDYRLEKSGEGWNSLFVVVRPNAPGVDVLKADLSEEALNPAGLPSNLTRLERRKTSHQR